MDILDILLDILLKPPQPFIGLFLVYLFVSSMPSINWFARKFVPTSVAFALYA